MLQPAETQTNPTVFVTEHDYDLLERLAAGRRSAAAELLRQELDRAVVLGEADQAPPFVRLGARVEYMELPSGRLRAVRLVRPEAADIDQGALSVLTHVGAALLGLSPGDCFSLVTENGSERVLVIVAVEAP